MIHLRVRLTAETPLSFRDGVDLAASELNRYVPGTALLGALAEAHARLRDDRAEFAALFLRERVRYGNAYPAGFSNEELSGSHLLPVRPIPLTARSSKRFGGFRYDRRDPGERYDGVTDALIPMALFALSDEARSDLLDPARSAGQGEGAVDLERIGGFYRRGAGPGSFGRARIGPDLRTRTGINYRTGTVQQSILYSTQVLPEGASFWGSWRIADGGEALRDTLEGLVEELVEGGMLRLGNNRTRGFGRVTLRLDDDEGDSAGALAARAAAFSGLLADAARAAGLAIPAGVYLPVTLASDALLHDELLRARLRLGPEDLAAAGAPGAELVFHTAAPRRVRGWNALLGVPRADTWAIGMGAVFLFRLPAGFAAWDALLAWQDEGVGLRRGEGYGQISLADPFHLELAGGVMV